MWFKFFNECRINEANCEHIIGTQKETNSTCTFAKERTCGCRFGSDANDPKSIGVQKSDMPSL
jgi:hypothetical protein